MTARLPDRGGFIDVLAEVLQQTGGTTLQFRDEGLLASAFARPDNLIAYGDTPDVARLAASLAFGIARNHPLVDGNKRAAALAFMITLLLNGQRLDATQTEVVSTFEALASGALDEEALADWARGRLIGDDRHAT